MRYLKQLLAAAAGAAVVFGLPVLLCLATPSTVDGITTLRFSPTTVTQLIPATAVVLAWVAWAWITVTVLLEIIDVARTARRGTIDLTIPTINGPRSLIRAVVVTALIGGAASPALAATTTASPVSISATNHQGHNTPSGRTYQQSTTTSAAAASQNHGQPGAGVIQHTVQPGDTTWQLAQRYYGDGHAFTKIMAANPQITSTTLLMPGQQLRIPDPIPTPTSHATNVHVGDTLASIASRYHVSLPSLLHANPQLTHPNLIYPGTTIHLPGASVPTPHQHPARPKPSNPHPPAPSATPSSPHTGTAAPPATPKPSSNTPSHRASTPSSSPATTPAPSSTTPPVTPGNSTPPPAANPTPTSSTSTYDTERAIAGILGAGGACAFVAAGVVRMINRRRTQARQDRTPGTRPVPTTPEQNAVETATRAAAAAINLDTVHHALRHLSGALSQTGHPIPALRFARYTPTAIDLVLQEPHTLPSPWSSTAAPTLWTLRADDLPTDDQPTAAAPWPALVPLGVDAEGGHILVDLEAVGCLTITGTPEHARATLAAVALAAAGTPWADDLQVTTVGALEGLTSLGSGRVAYRESLDVIAPALTARATRDAVELGERTLGQVRAEGVQEHLWTPEVLILPGPLSEQDRDTVATLLRTSPRVAIATVTTGQEPMTPWELVLEDDGTGLLHPTGLPITAVALHADSYQALGELVAGADQYTEPPAPAELLDAEPHQQPDAAPVLLDVSVGPAPRPELIDLTATPAAVLAAAAEDEPSGAHPSPALDDAARSGAEPGAPAQVEVGSHPVVAESGPVAEPAPVEAVAMPEAVQVDTDPRQPLQVVEDQAVDVQASQGAQVEDLEEAANEPAGTTEPRLLVLGPVALQGADTQDTEARRLPKLIEVAAIIALTNPTPSEFGVAYSGSSREMVAVSTRRSQISRVNRLWSHLADGPRATLATTGAKRYRFSPELRTDWDDLVDLTGTEDIGSVSTRNLEAALQLVRGMPFSELGPGDTGDTHDQLWVWRFPHENEMVTTILNVCWELARRYHHDGRNRDADRVIRKGLAIDPGDKPLLTLWVDVTITSGDTRQCAELAARIGLLAGEHFDDLKAHTQALIARSSIAPQLEALLTVADGSPHRQEVNAR